MTKAVCLLALCFFAGAARASPVSYVPACGPPNVVGSERDAFWSQPGDLNGVIASSEQILSFGLETECANDFVLTGGQWVGTVRWWGAFFNTSMPCSPGITTPGFNMRFYQDAGCVPGATLADLSITSFIEESVGCQGGAYPIRKWTADIPIYISGDGTYWLGVQMKDHAFPPQFGRLSSGSVLGCDSVFRSDYFAYQDWTPVVDPFGVAFDCSQELECMICGGGTTGVDAPPATRAIEKASWGRVKGLYR